MTDKVQKIREVLEKRYEYWKEKEFNSHSIESETRMSECQHLLLMVNSMQEEPVSKDLEEAAYHNCIDRLSKESIEDFKAGASWKKEKMMRDAVDAFIYKGNIRLKEWPLSEKYGKHLDSVKLIIIKKNKDE